MSTILNQATGQVMSQSQFDAREQAGTLQEGVYCIKGEAYSKPASGIPSTDMTTAVQTSLSLANTAVQPETGKGLFSGSHADLTNKDATNSHPISAITGLANALAQLPPPEVWNTVREMYEELSSEDIERTSNYNVGTSFFLKPLNVPDLWVSAIETAHSYQTYVSDAQFIEDLRSAGSAGLHLGWYRLMMLEGDYPTRTEFDTVTGSLLNRLDDVEMYKFASSASAGEVLTADGNGGASYQPPSAGGHLYQHNISVTTNGTFTFSFFNSDSTAYTTLSALAAAFYATGNFRVTASGTSNNYLVVNVWAASASDLYYTYIPAVANADNNAYYLDMTTVGAQKFLKIQNALFTSTMSYSDTVVQLM